MTRRYFEALVRRRGLGLALVGLVTLASAALTAARVRPDFAVELLFPQRSQSKIDYDRYKRDFPFEDARALVIVESPDLFTREGIARIGALEHDLAAIPGVIDTDGLTTTKDVFGFDAGDGDTGIRTEVLFPRPDLPPEELARRRGIATQDPLFRWTLAPPDGRATTIRITLEQGTAAKDERRVQFLKDLRAVVAKHERPGQRLTINGMPVIRAQYTELIAADMGVLLPTAIAVTLVILTLSFRSFAAVGAALGTILVSVLWTLGVAGLVGYPIQLLTQVTPIVVMIVSISDTVHIVSHMREGLAAGRSIEDAIIDAGADSFGPCLLTEVVIAFGFLGLWFQDVLLISQFGFLTAAGMLLTWAANMTALPLLLLVLRPRAAAGAAGAASASAGAHASHAGHAHAAGTAVTRALERFLGWVDGVTKRRPGRIALATLGIVLAAAATGQGIVKEYRAFDDLDPDHPIQQDIRYTEETFGGSCPLAVYLEPVGREVLVVGADGALGERIAAAIAASPLAPRIARLSVAELEQRLFAAAPPAGAGADAVAVAPREAPPLAAILLVDPAATRLLERVQEDERTLGIAVALCFPAGLGEEDRRRFLARGVLDAIDLDAEDAEARLAALPRAGEAMLDPGAVALMDRVAAKLEDLFPELEQASSAADLWRKVHRLWVGDDIAAEEPLPKTRGVAAQELTFFDRKQLRDFLAPDNATAAVFGSVPDIGYGKSDTDRRLAELRRYLDEEEQATGYRLTLTALFAIGNGIYESLVGGLSRSLGSAALISLIVFVAVLRSWRLGLIALVPNLLPLLLTFGVMAALGIELKPTTVICFSITLVIADDDTIQFLVRYRRRFLARAAATSAAGSAGAAGASAATPADGDVYGEVASDTLGESGLAMLLTALSVSAGFFTLLLSRFVALRNLGLLIGVSLFTAVFADLFLSPILLRWFRPRIAAGAEPR